MNRLPVLSLMLLLVVCLCLIGCERRVVRSKGYAGFQISTPGATPAPVAISQAPPPPTMKTQRGLDLFKPFKSAFAGIGKLFKPQEPPKTLVQPGSPDSASRPSWRKVQPQAGPVPQALPPSPDPTRSSTHTNPQSSG